MLNNLILWHADSGFYDDLVLPRLFQDEPYAMANNPTTQQTATVAIFDGAEGYEAATFIRNVNRAMDLYGWDDAQTKNAASTRLSGKAATWLAGLEALDKAPTRWAPQNPPQAADRVFKDMLLKRFCPTGAKASITIASLKQKDHETIAEFYDRVVVAITQKNIGIRGEAHYAALVADQIKTIFLTGAKSYLRKRVLGTPGAPDNADAMLDIMREAEETASAHGAADEDQHVMAIHNRPMQNMPRGRGNFRPQQQYRRQPQNNGYHNNGYQNNGPQNRNRPTCYNCGQAGHTIFRCTQQWTKEGIDYSNRMRSNMSRGGRGNRRPQQHRAYNVETNHMGAAKDFAAGAPDTWATPEQQQTQYEVEFVTGNDVGGATSGRRPLQ